MPIPNLIREQALLLVAHMLNEAVASVCASCEQEIGLQRIPPGVGRSHGYCKRHFIKQAIAYGVPHLADQAKSKPDDAYPPDLEKHPELIDRTAEQTAAAGRDSIHTAQGQHLARR